MLIMDVTVDDFPIFSIDIEDWTPPNCRYADVGDLFNAVSFTAFAILLINIRSSKKNIVLLLILVIFVLFVLHYIY